MMHFVNITLQVHRVLHTAVTELSLSKGSSVEQWSGVERGGKHQFWATFLTVRAQLLQCNSTPDGGGKASILFLNNDKKKPKGEVEIRSNLKI